MLTPNQTVYYTSGPLVQKAVFIGYDGSSCILRSTPGGLMIRRSRVFTAEDADQQGLLNRGVSA